MTLAGLDLRALATYLTPRRPDLAQPPLTASLIAGGRSNLTYLVQAGPEKYVLRRPPLGHVLATAHDMGREFRVISALAPTAVPVPEALLHCPDPEVLGAPFYLMSRVPGTVFRTREQTDRLDPDDRRRLAYAMIDTLADLHLVDPGEVGLADFGRPDGYLARQVRRWRQQLDRSRSRDLPGIDELHDRLAASVPSSGPARVVHGDYRLDNLLADPERMTITGVLDWEMATLGDPLADLGVLLTYWDVMGGGNTRGNPVADGLGTDAGFPPGAELIDRYATRTGTGVPDLGWHVALGCYKLAVICEGIHYRFTLGQTVGEGFERIGSMVAPLVHSGLSMLED